MQICMINMQLLAKYTVRYVVPFSLFWELSCSFIFCILFLCISLLLSVFSHLHLSCSFFLSRQIHFASGWASFFSFCIVVLFFPGYFSAFCDFLFNFIILSYQFQIMHFLLNTLRFCEIYVHWKLSNKFCTQHGRNVNSKFLYSFVVNCLYLKIIFSGVMWDIRSLH